MEKKLAPPIAERRTHTTHWHNVTLEDPYHWLRDPGYPEVKDEAVLTYLNAENAYFEQFYQPHQALTDAIFEELKARQPEEDSSVPYLYRGWRYQWRFAKGAQYRVWLRAPEQDPDAWEVLLDETTLAEGHEYFRLGGMAVSPDGKTLLYATDTNGSERFTLKHRELTTGDEGALTIENTLGTPLWAADGQAFYYVALNDQWRPYQVRRYSLTSGDDTLVYEEADDAFFVGVGETQSERFVVISTGDHVTSESWLIDQAQSEAAPVCVAPRRTGHEYSIDHRGEHLYIRSNRNRKNFDLYTAPIDAFEEAGWQLYAEGSEARYITDHLCLRDYVIIEQRQLGLDEIVVMAADGSEHTIALPDAAGSVSLGTNPTDDTHVLRLYYESMVRPGTVYDYDLRERTLTALKTEEIPSGYDPTEFSSERLLIEARDGAQVPVSIVWRNDAPPSADTPLYLYGYGAYGHAISPGFSRSRISLLERGFSFAIAHIRGGDDMGYGWYEAGKGAQRTNTFNDFVDVARGLVERSYAGEGRIAIAGGSAGGELMGAVVNQAPSLWGAVAAHVPFVDVLNTMLDGSLPLTPIEWPEWGNPIEDVEAFHHIRSYSPYDQLEPGRYPPMLVTAGLNDPRVTYWEPAKYVAKLRHLKEDDSVLLLKTNMGAGHGGQSGRFDALREVAEEYVFFLVSLGKAAG